MQGDNPAVSSKVVETNSDEYWEKIIIYLMSLNVPDADKDEIQCIRTRAKAFFILDDILWCRNSNKPPLQVIFTAWNEAYIMLVSCIDYALDMTCIQSVSQCFIVCGIL